MLAERAILKDKARDDSKKARAAAVKVADCIFYCIFERLYLIRPSIRTNTANASHQARADAEHAVEEAIREVAY
jgi:hypothetical protein